MCPRNRTARGRCACPKRYLESADDRWHEQPRPGCRLVGTRLVVAPPEYHGITVVAQLSARVPAQADDVRRAAVRALYRYLVRVT